MIVIACPGQGSQTPGFLAPWVAETPFREHLEALSDGARLDLVKHGTESDADTIRDTKIAQPLIVAAGLLALRALLADGRRSHVGGVAGHSVGEITAAEAAGILTESEAMLFVRERGLAMSDAAALTPTGMSAFVGGDETELLAVLETLDLQPANFNGGGQIVVAGSLENLARLPEVAPRGARVIPLQVAGAFHTRYMQPAVEHLTSVAGGLSPLDPTLTIYSNRDGGVVDSGAQFVELLVGQVSSPVRWDRCMASFADAGITGLIEVAPAGALTGLAKRGLKGIPSVAIKTPDDLAAAIELLTS